MKKENKGITLIALVITIIVLLILAGVTVITLTGDNGLIAKASDSKQASKEAKIKERIMLVVTNARVNNSLLIDRDVLDDGLKKEFGENNYELIPVGEGFLIAVDNIEYLVNGNGYVNDGNKIEVSNIENAGDLSKGGQYDGLTEDTAYRITCIEDLVKWTDNYNTYKNKFIKLENTIDFNSTASYKNARTKTTDINGNGIIEELITELTTGTGFKPINEFYGIFDGQNNEIQNIYENIITKAGLFMNSGNSAIIKNLGITGEIYTTVSDYAGGICGYSGRNDSQEPDIKIYNCYNKININAPNCNYVGGLIGGNHGDSADYYICNCYNFGKISGGNYAGGLIGKSNGGTYGGKKRIVNSCNYGNIKANYVGGLIGYDYYNIPYINNSFSVGNLDSTSTNKAGGLCYTTMVIPSDRLNKAYYLDDGKTDIEMVRVAILGWKSTKGSPLQKEYMQSQEFVSELNTYVDDYNEEHKNDEDFVKLNRWKYNQGDYPTFE